MKKLILVFLVILLAVALVMVGCSNTGQSSPQTSQPPSTAQSPSASQPQQTPAASQGAKTIKIGIIYGITGPDSPHQIMERDAALLAIEYVNEKGGVTINGEKYLFEGDVADNKGTPPGSIDAATKLVQQDNVKFIIGCVIPVQVDAVASVTEKAGVLFAATRTDVIHADRPLSFTTNYTFAAPLPFLYEVLLSKYPNVKTIGFMIGDESGARAVGEVSKQIAQGRGLTSVGDVIHPWETSDYYSSWTKMKSLNPDAVDNGLSLPNSTAALVKQGREIGYKGPMIAAIPGDPNTLIQMIGAQYANDFINATYDPYGPEAPAMVQDIVKRWEAKYQSKFDADGTEAFDSIYVLSQVLQKAQSLDPVQVAKVWESMPTVETVKGTAKMGGLATWGLNHMVFNPCPVSIYNQGKSNFVNWFDSYMP
jgi:branched-chain amino acid transport system substrate-binding protein